MEKTIFDILLDKNNHDDIVMKNTDGQDIKFAQKAIIPYFVDGVMNVFVLLEPLTIPSLQGKILVYRIDMDEDKKLSIVLEQDQNLIDEVYNEYERQILKEE